MTALAVHGARAELAPALGDRIHRVDAGRTWCRNTGGHTSGSLVFEVRRAALERAAHRAAVDAADDGTGLFKDLMVVRQQIRFFNVADQRELQVAEDEGIPREQFGFTPDRLAADDGAVGAAGVAHEDVPVLQADPRVLS